MLFLLFIILVLGAIFGTALKILAWMIGLTFLMGLLLGFKKA